MPLNYKRLNALWQAQMGANQQAQMMQAMYGQTQTASGLGSLFGGTAGTGANVWATNTVTTVPTLVQTHTVTSTGGTGSISNSLMNSLYASQGQQMAAGNAALVLDTLRLMGECEIADGEPCKVILPDGGVLEVDADGSYRINDKDAKVIYRANRIRDFNSFINASDKLESFIKFCGDLGVRQGEMLDIPVRHFIAWLIVEAALADGEKPEEIATLPDLREHVMPRCVGCGRFIPRKLTARKITFCRPVCLERELAA